ncbi:hypothetical protein MTO96_000660 [Rhipicephalus appendiculatus]
MMEVTVDGEDLPPELFSKDFGWQTAVARRSSNKATVARSLETKTAGFAPNAGGSAGGRQNGERVKKKVIKAARMPPLPKEDAKIILRPRGGLDVSSVGVTTVGRAIMKASGIDEAKASSDVICPNLQQNIVVVSTPDRENASRYTRIKTIEVASKLHEVNAYEAAPHSTCKGVIRGITLSDGPVDLERNIVNTRNPLALGAKRIKNTGTVIVVFDGLKVPNFVRYGPVLVRCFLYRKQVDNCYTCGRIGHRADVCPSPNETVCRGCGASKPDDHHQCVPKCKLCGGPHITADKICRQRYQIPLCREEKKMGEGGRSFWKQGRWRHGPAPIFTRMQGALQLQALLFQGTLPLQGTCPHQRRIQNPVQWAVPFQRELPQHSWIQVPV